MKIILASAKTFGEVTSEPIVYSPHCFYEKTNALLQYLNEYTQEDLSTWMKLSPSLANLTHSRHAQFDGDLPRAYPAADYLDGEAYRGLDSQSLDAKSRDYLSRHMYILSGLYGAIPALYPIQAYRLEMGQKMTSFEATNLYVYWRCTLTDYFLELLRNDPGESVLVNLASTEYSKVLDFKSIEKEHAVLHISFKEEVQEGQYKAVSMYAKRARGELARWLATEQIEQIEKIKQFDQKGYRYNEKLSTPNHYIFTRLKK